MAKQSPKTFVPFYTNYGFLATFGNDMLTTDERNKRHYLKQGMEQERARAEEQRQGERLAQAKTMKAKGYPLEDIAEITGLPLHKIKAL